MERFVPLRGHSVEIVRRDYGLDLLIFFHDRRGFLLDGHVSIQVKATDAPRYSSDRRSIAVRIDRRDLNAWTSRLEPVILVVYDVRANRAFWCMSRPASDAIRQVRAAARHCISRRHSG